MSTKFEPVVIKTLWATSLVDGDVIYFDDRIGWQICDLKISDKAITFNAECLAPENPDELGQVVEFNVAPDFMFRVYIPDGDGRHAVGEEPIPAIDTRDPDADNVILPPPEESAGNEPQKPTGE